jgi:8-oxo-dGTP pyrophosphatase MutT (NUDIX family)
MTNDNPAPIVRTDVNLVFGNKYITVFDDPVVMPGGREGTYLRIVESNGRPGVAMLPLAGNLVGIVRTFRYPTGAWEWAIPRGFAHSDDPTASARNELTEELGGEPDDLVELGVTEPNSGLLTSRVHVFLAVYNEPTVAPVDTEEVQELRWLPVSEFLQSIVHGKITDGFTLAAVSLALLKGRIAL